MITSVLVANRGEIARRVFRTCRDLGIATVAVYSDADANAPYVREADSAVHLPGNAPADTYLRIELLIEAAKSAGADAIHPGYGFLSERADFARAVIDAGLTWIGPPPSSIDEMGSKIESKRLMKDAGVPVLEELAPASVKESDLPVLIKASAGGGGRGMRIVRSLDVLQQEVELAQTEAQSAFGDPTVFCEPYLATGRHIEVQVMADTHGTVWAVGERECSIQRRHQKVVEEAPSPLVEKIDGMREELFEASRKAASAIGYTGAGTVEFLADENGKFFFLEMNTRLQVEHPVTECTTGLDLVALQIAVAEGAALPSAEPPAAHGHSIEVRLYAEDPSANWAPQSGTVHRFRIPGVKSSFENLAAGIRLDSGVEDGSEVGIHYDPMLAKIISYAPTREAAARSLAGAIERAQIHGLVTNRDLLVRVLRHPAFLAGDTDTAFFDTHGLDTLSAPLADKEAGQLSALAAALADSAANRASAPVMGRVASGFRNIYSQPQSKAYTLAGEDITVEYRFTKSGVVHGDGEPIPVTISRDGDTTAVTLTTGGVARTFRVASYGALRAVDSSLGPISLTRLPRFEDPSDHVAPGSLVAQTPGSVVRIAAAVGDKVEAGQPILWLEAMKMQHQINAPAAGVITELPVSLGQQVDIGTVLAVVTSDEEEA